MDRTTLLKRDQLEQELTVKGWKDHAFREALINDPKAALEEHLGASLPEDLNVVVHAEESDTVHLVLPFMAQDQRLTDTDLDMLSDGRPQMGSEPPDCTVDTYCTPNCQSGKSNCKASDECYDGNTNATTADAADCNSTASNCGSPASTVLKGC